MAEAVLESGVPVTTEWFLVDVPDARRLHNPPAVCVVLGLPPVVASASRRLARTSARPSAVGHTRSSARGGSSSGGGREVLVRDQRQQMRDAVQARAALVVGVRPPTTARA